MDDFTIEYMEAITSASGVGDTPSDGGARRIASAPPEQITPNTPATPASAATPASSSTSNASSPQWYRTLDNIYDATSAQDIDSDELYLISGKEPMKFAEAEPHAAWQAAIIKEMAAIKENKS